MRAFGPTPIYFGSSSARLFGWFHQPERQTRSTAIVICNPLGDDIVRAHRSLRHLAESLTTAGYPVLRFDFHGTGDSSSDERAPGRVAAWQRDLGVAIDELRARSGIQKISVIGLRLGATIAAEVAATRGDVSSIVLWHPFADGSAFTAETLRMHKMHRMLEPESFAAGPKDYPDGEEALGFFLTKETIADLAKLDLMGLQRPPAPRLLAIDAANIPSDERLLEKLRGLGADVTYRHLPGHKFLISIPHRSSVPQEIIDAIVAWFDEGYPATAAVTPAPATASGSHVETTYEEEPFVLGGGPQPLFGVLVKPAADRVRANRPAIIMMNAGTVHRIGPHRLYVGMARDLAELGFYVLRVDLSGIGDSPVSAGEENKCYPADGIGDGQRAMTQLGAKVGADRFILTGLCSGADIAFQLGVRDKRVAGVVMMNPRTFCVHDLALVDAYMGARYYQNSFFKKEKWVKLLSGKVDVVRVARMVAPKVKGAAVRGLQRVADQVISRVRPKPNAGDDTTHADVPACLRLMAERGVDTFLVTSVHDPGVDYVDVHFGSKMKELAALSNYRREDLEGTDHTFTSVWSQQHVKTTIRDHLAKRHLA